MSYTIISDSKYGVVVSGKDVSMAFDLVRFVNNKFQNVKIGERMMKITENSPVVFNYPEQEGVFVEPAAIINATETIQQKKGQPHITANPRLRVAMAVCAGAGLIFGGVGAATHYKYVELIDDAIKNENESTIEQYRLRANLGSAGGIVGGLLFGIGVVGFTWTIFY